MELSTHAPGMRVKRGLGALVLAVVAVFVATPAYALGNENPIMTPGATDLRVTQATIGQTICTRGYTKGVRNVSNQTKHRVYVAYGISRSQQRKYVIDHLIPLEVGGSNDITNLWPEPKADAKIKDKLENRLHASVCNGSIPLAAAQAQFTALATPSTTAPPVTTPATSPATTPPPPTAAPVTPPPTTEPPPPQTEPPPPPTEPPPPPQTDPPAPTGNCNPNYTPCVPNDPVDVDCAGGGGNGPSYVTGPVTVTGTDVYGLDSDHNGIGCE